MIFRTIAALCLPASLFVPHNIPQSQGITIALDDAVPYHAPKPKWHSSLSKRDQAIWIIAASAWGECRGGGLPCMQATINVLANRAKRYGDTIEQEALKPYQLSCWNPAESNHRQMWKIGRSIDPHSPDGIAWTIAKGLAVRQMAHDLPDLTRGARWYHVKGLHTAWDYQMRKVAYVGNHVYFKRIGEA